jgi:hypothetical protein
LIAALGCGSATAPEAVVAVRIENPVFSLFLNKSRTLMADARIVNESSYEVTPFLCANVRVERESAPGVFTDVSVQLECASIGLAGRVIPPHGELVVKLSAPVLIDAAPLGETYRVKFDIGVDGNRRSRTVTSDPFVVSAETGT